MKIDKKTHLDANNGWKTFLALNKEEALLLGAWLVYHSLDCFISKNITIYQSNGSGIGISTVVRCSCGKGRDVTDYSAW